MSQEQHPEYDAETRFRARAAAGSREEGLELLARLDALYGT
jgi:hypothetical protein